MRKRVVIGIGTGRCGSVSLSLLLNKQPGAQISHEKKPLLPWAVSPKILRKRLRGIEKSRSAFAGDVASSWLPYIPTVLLHYPDAKIVCLQRDREDTVRSFIDKLKGKKNHWMHHHGVGWKKDPRWDPCYPKYKATNLEEAIGLYWDDYYREADALCKQFPDNVRLWSTQQALNSQASIIELLSFIGIKKENQVVTTGIMENRHRMNPRPDAKWVRWIKKMTGRRT